jgi:parallel beta-helix repeat protein
MRTWSGTKRDSRGPDFSRARSHAGFRPCVEGLEDRTALAADIYVAMNGSDTFGSGGVDNPFATLAYALEIADPGDTVILRGGIYAGGVTVYEPDLTIRSQAGEWATVLTPTNDPELTNCITFDVNASRGKLQRLQLMGGHFYTVKLESYWDQNDPLSYGASDILIEDCKLLGSGRDVIKIGPGNDNVTIRRSEIFLSGLHDPSNAEGIDNTGGDRMLVQDCSIHDIATSGIYAKGGAQNAVIERNLIQNIGGLGIEVGQATDYEFFNLFENPATYESIDTVVRNNIVVNTVWAGINIQGSLRPQVYNNTLVNVAQAGQAGILLRNIDHWLPGDIPFYVPNVDVAIINNLVVLSAAGSTTAVEIREGAVAVGLGLSNNHYYVPSGTAYFWDQTPEVGYYGDLAGWQVHTGGDAGSSEGDPLLDTRYHLSPGSPLIDAGLLIDSLVDDFDGDRRVGGYDIGADEYSPGVPQAPAPPSEPPVLKEEVLSGDFLVGAALPGSSAGGLAAEALLPDRGPADRDISPPATPNGLAPATLPTGLPAPSGVPAEGDTLSFLADPLGEDGESIELTLGSPALTGL